MPTVPGVASAECTETEEVLRSCVVHGVEGSSSWSGRSPDGDRFESLISRAIEQRLLGALAQMTHEGALVLSDDQLCVLASHHTRWASHGLGLERLTLDVSERLASADLSTRVLKGVALAHIVYDDPSWRLAADLDLLIPAQSFDGAVSLATRDLGGEPALPELRPGFDREFGKEAMVQIGPYELDLHRTFVTGPFGLTIDLDELFDDATPFTLGGRTVHALGPTHMFVHACYNAALGDHPVRWCSIRDLLLCRDRLGVDLDEVVSTARRWRATGIVRRAAELVVEVAGADVAGEIVELTALEVSRRESWLLKSYLTPARSYSRPLAALAVIPGIRPRWRYARAVVAPSEEYLRSRGWSRGRHVRRAIGRLRRAWSPIHARPTGSRER